MFRYTQILLLLALPRDQLEYNTIKCACINYNNVTLLQLLLTFSH